MTYDLYLFSSESAPASEPRLAPTDAPTTSTEGADGADGAVSPEAAQQRNPWDIAEEGPQREQDPGPLTPSAEARKQRINKAVTTMEPQLKPFEFNHDELARLAGTTIEDAKRRWRYIELSDTEDGSGIHIELHDDWAFLSVPYWHDGPTAEIVFRRVWEVTRAIASAGAYWVYDRQLKQFLNLETDFDELLRNYCEGEELASAAMNRIATHGVRRPRAWWQVW